MHHTNLVGPVLQVGSPLTDAVIEAIRGANEHVELVDRGAYVRVMVPGVCVLRAKDVESLTGESFSLPSDLESLMSSFKGSIRFEDDEVVWRAPDEREDLN